MYYLNYIDLFPHSKAVYKKGFLCKEEVATLTNTDLTLKEEVIENKNYTVKEGLPKLKVKPLPYLQFDMIAWWQNKA